jgi:glutathione synthase/RimK-type ligase-like ATP-grasp enzyme
METLVVVTQPGDWPLDLPGVRVVTARSYLSDPEFIGLRGARIFNLCRQYRYQAYGYYVSLLAEARGHKPMPTVLTMQDLRSSTLLRIASNELSEEISRSLAADTSDRFVLSIYFGHNIDKRHDKLASALFRMFPAPLMRASFVCDEGEWQLKNLNAIPTSAIPDDHRAFAFEAAQAFFTRRERRARPRARARFDLAILRDKGESFPPSNSKAIVSFIDAAESFGISAEEIEKDDFGSLLEYDALFIRSTTAVNHYTYRFSRRAHAEGMVVIDDPVSILRCTNKVYLAELLSRNGLPVPRTLILDRDGEAKLLDTIGLPCILKQPDSSSSMGVVKAEDPASLKAHLTKLFEVSDLVIAQEFMPTPFDWRIGILDRRPLYAAKYFMAHKHWQIIKRDGANGRIQYGEYEVMPVEDVPAAGLATALKAANLIGDGLYGVDLKQVGDAWYVIEVNDCPNLDAKVEDKVLGDELYRRVMGVFLRRLEDKVEGRAPR